MYLKYSRTLLLLFTATLPLGHHTTTPPEHFPIDNENTTYGQFETASATITDCIPPYCYDIVNKTLKNIQNDNLIAPINKAAPTAASKSYDSDRSMNNPPSYAANFDEQHWARSSVIYGLLTIANTDFVNERCHSELQYIYNGIRRKEIWAIKGMYANFFIIT